MYVYCLIGGDNGRLQYLRLYLLKCMLISVVFVIRWFVQRNEFNSKLFIRINHS